MSEFFFALVRITCAQIFRAAGIDRCSPSTLDAVTDILLRHMDLLATRASKLAKLSGRDQVEIQDLTTAMEQVGLIHPHALLDVDDVDPNGIVGFEDFVEWAKGPVPQEARRISRIAHLPNGGPATSSAAAAAAANAAVAAAVDKGENVPSSAAQVMANNNNTGEGDTTENSNAEWLTTLMKKQVKVGHEAKFKGTVLSGNDKVLNDTRLAGGPEDYEIAYD